MDAITDAHALDPETCLEDLMTDQLPSNSQCNDSISQLDQLKNRLHFKSSQLDSLESKVGQLTELQEKHAKEELWGSSMHGLNAKLQALKGDYQDLFEMVHTNSFPDISVISSAVQSLSLQHEELKKKYLEESLQHEELKKKYLEESKERKQLYNELLELKGNIRVFCRCRPLSEEEIAGRASPVVEYDESKDTELIVNVHGALKKNFKFDRVFPPDANQEHVFADTAPVVVSVLDGYNVCIFAYGQTGTGKTFTMEGTPGNRGVNFRTLEELFRIAVEREGQYKYDFSVSVLEVYNEQIRDLLACQSQQGQPIKKLDIKQVAEGIQHVPGLVEAPVHDMTEVWEVLQTGSRARAVGPTNANEFSSRSHCILNVLVTGQSLISGNVTKSKLWLVDLAGSERIAKTDVNGDRLKEAQCINKSLSALGDVISALAAKSSHIPYRNSKLTHLLQDSLGGDSKTLMFVQISPHERDMGETLCSLNFASRVRGVELGPARRQQDVGELFKHKQMVDKIRQDGKEVKKMEESLQNLEIKFKSREQMCRHLQEKVRELESQLTKEKKARLQCETKFREQQRQPDKSHEKPPLIRNLPGSKSISRRTPLRKLNNILEPLTENKKSSFLESCINKQGNRSFTRKNASESFANAQPSDKENRANLAIQGRKKGRFSLAAPIHRTSLQPAQRRISMIPTLETEGKVHLPSRNVYSAARKISMIPMPSSKNALSKLDETVHHPRQNVCPVRRRVSMIPLPISKNAAFESEEVVDVSNKKARTARRTSISAMSHSSIPVPRTSIAAIPVRRNEVSTFDQDPIGQRFELSPMEKELNSNDEASHHDCVLSTVSSPVSLKRVKNSHALDKFRRRIQSKLLASPPMIRASPAIKETLKSGTDGNLGCPSSVDPKPSPNDSSRFRRLSIRAWATHSASANVPAQRVLRGNRQT